MPQPERPILNHRQTIAIPELLRLISSFLSQSDAFHMAVSSHMCFYAAVVQIWRFVPGARHLFALLPGASFETENFTTTIVSYINTVRYVH